MLYVVIDEVVYWSVLEVMMCSGYMCCVDYVIVGVWVLMLLIGQFYWLFVGGEVMDFGGGNLYVLCMMCEWCCIVWYLL